MKDDHMKNGASHSIRQLISGPKQKDTKTDGEKRVILLHRFYFKDLSDIPFLYFDCLHTFNASANLEIPSRIRCGSSLPNVKRT